ncbi:hypothetical protein B0H19DRAFT_1140127 [Mycena capillaripes]|nr:hypothetical protein B0H19DRAFT_1140127 [Mycena capillaripes]
MNNNLTTSRQPQSHFRAVNLGELNLLEEIDEENLDENCPTSRRRKRTGSVTVRRFYSARIFGKRDPMTAVVYNGPQFEQILAQAREKQRYRHPSFAQLFGFTCSASLNALIYHDEMITISQIKKMHAASALASVYIEYETRQQFTVRFGNLRNFC